MTDSARSVLERARSRVFTNEDGESEALELLPPATDEEISELQSGLPGPIPDDVRSLLELASGFCLFGDEIDFLGRSAGQYLEGASACQLDLNNDGCGNSWFVDVRPDGTWGGVYFACHDPPVLLLQSRDLVSFLQDYVKALSADSWDDSPLVRGDDLDIWPDNPLARSASEIRGSEDEVLREFSIESPEDALIVDLRHAKPGEGLNWGCFGPETEIRRCGTELVFGLIPPPAREPKRGGWLSRIFRR